MLGRFQFLIVIGISAALSACSPAAPDDAKTYLISLVNVPLGRDEQIMAFRFATWGVRVQAVCVVPPGWTIRAGGSLNPGGVLEGEGSLGTSWFRDTSPSELDRIVLVTLAGPLRGAPVNDATGEVPATFAGTADVSTDKGVRQIALTTENLRLIPADRCPSAGRTR